MNKRRGHVLHKKITWYLARRSPPASQILSNVIGNQVQQDLPQVFMKYGSAPCPYLELTSAAVLIVVFEDWKAKIGGGIVFKNALAEALPFADAQFDAVLSTVMLHHLPRKVRQQCAHEIRRVLKPGGRVLVVDFGGAAQESESLFGRLHKHGYVKLPEILAVLSEAGLNSVHSGAVGISDLQFVLAVAPCIT